MRNLTVILAVSCLMVCAVGQTKIDSAVFGALEARLIGPATMSGRISAIAGNPKDSRILYVGSAGGGLWKTVNGGTTFRPLFDRYPQSIGAVAVDPSNPNIVWIGTGESWVRNSVSVGNGIYRSNDAGETWQFVGLPDSERIAKVVVDPKDSSTVYVAVLGKLWGPSEDRGIYKTTDSGKTWKKILYINPDTGCSDLDIDPQEPQILYAGMWEFRRSPWFFKSGGSGSGLYRTADGGTTWNRIQEGLPEGELGRIAVAVSPARPSTVYALVEAKKSALLRSDDLGRTWQTVNTGPQVGERPFYFSLLVPDPGDYKRLYKPGLLLSLSTDGGKTLQPMAVGLSMGIGFHPDLHALWIDPRLPSTLYLGTDGGVYKSLDSGSSWSFLRNLPVSQFYHVSFDLERPFNVYGGLQDNGSWMGPSEGPGGVRNKDWRVVGFGDGFYVFAHMTDKNILYSQYQGGRLLRFHRSTGEIKSIMPRPKPGDPKFRFNWNAAVALSASQPDTIYLGAQFLLRSRDRGESWEKLSPDLTSNDPDKQKQRESGGLTIDNTSAENHCTIYAIAESPKDPKVIWIGTDDGNIQLTRDGGKHWIQVTDRITGAPKHATVSSVEPGKFAAGTAYVTFDAHGLNDMRPYVYKTTDFGDSWSFLATSSIRGYAHVIREDPVKPDLLFLGTEWGLWLTIDGGQQWAQFTGGLPMVAVRDMAIHPRDHALVLATHGRGIAIVDDITPLRQLTPQVLESPLTVLESRPTPVRLQVTEQSFSGNDEFIGPNPPEVAWVVYYLKERHLLGDFSAEILDSEGKSLAKLVPGTRRGINRVGWAMRLRPPRVPTAGTLDAGSLIGPIAPEGIYTAKLVKDGQTYTTKIQLVADPRSPHAEADRKLQQATVMRIYRALEDLGFASASMVHLRDQSLQRALATKEETLKKGLEAFAEETDQLNQSLSLQRGGTFSGEQKLREMLGELYGDVSRYGGRPSQDLLDRLLMLEQQAREKIAEWEKLAGRIGDLNVRLKSSQLPPLTRLTREVYERQGSR